ncbi:MAG: methyltransferase family protein [Dehalococcoidia bacterium]
MDQVARASENDSQAAGAMLQIIQGFMDTQALHVVAQLRIADLLKDAPRTGEDLARATNSHTLSLTPLLRALTTIGATRRRSRSSRIAGVR